MKPRFLYIIVLCLLVNCKEKGAKVRNKPDWVIEESKMVDIIVDLRIIDAATYINTNAPPRDKSKDWQFVMKKHGVSDSVFRKSHDYYAEHAEVASKLYEEVIDRISEMQADHADGQ